MDRKKRTQYLIDPSFQIQFILKFCVIVIVTSLMIGGSVFLLTRNSTTVAIENTKVLVKPTSDFILPSISLTVFIVSIFSACGVIILTLFVTHKIVGPVFRLRKEINLMKEGNLVRNFSIRNRDQLKDLAQGLSSMASIFRTKHRECKDAYHALARYLEKKDFCVSTKDKGELLKKLEEINNTLSYFKV